MTKYIFIIPLLISIAYYTPSEMKLSNNETVSDAFLSADTSINQITYKHSRNVVHCTYNGARSGDCLHVVFSCGDFGLSERDLPEKDEEL